LNLNNISVVYEPSIFNFPYLVFSYLVHTLCLHAFIAFVPRTASSHLFGTVIWNFVKLIQVVTA